MCDLPTITGLPRSTEPDLRHYGNDIAFFIDSPHDPYALVATTDGDGVTFAIGDDDGDGASTTLTAGQANLAATELLRINGTNLAEFYVSEDGYPALHHVPPGSGEGAEGHLVVFVDAGDNLLDLVSAATGHVCGADDE
jgi:hypothetical protein